MRPVSCHHCKAFYPEHLTRCPLCGVKRSGWPTVVRLIVAFALACLIVWLVDRLPFGAAGNRPPPTERGSR